MKRVYSKKEAYRRNYIMCLSFSNKVGLGETNLKDALSVLERDFKNEDFLFVKSNKKISFFFPTELYKYSQPDSLNNKIEKALWKFFMGSMPYTHFPQQT